MFLFPSIVWPLIFLFRRKKCCASSVQLTLRPMLNVNAKTHKMKTRLNKSSYGVRLIHIIYICMCVFAIGKMLNRWRLFLWDTNTNNHFISELNLYGFIQARIIIISNHKRAVQPCVTCEGINQGIYYSIVQWKTEWQWVLIEPNQEVVTCKYIKKYPFIWELLLLTCFSAIHL